MARETAENQDKDDKVAGASEGSDQRQERTSSVRDSINAAIEEHSEIDAKQETKELKEDKKKAKIKDDVEDIEVVDTTSEDKTKKEKKEIKEPKTEELVEASEQPEEIKQSKASKIPAGLPKDIKDTWATLPPNVQQFVTRINKESADQKAAHGREIAKYKELDAAIAPYLPSIQQLGVTPAQTIDRLFQWMNALAGPNKYQVIQQLANDFGINLEALYAPRNNSQQQQDNTQQNNQQNSQQQNQQDEHQYNTDPRVIEAMQTMYDEMQGMQQNNSRQREQVAAQAVNTWAGLQQDGTFKNKPYFPHVRQMMFTLLSSGSIPLVNGNLDLDTAYDYACNAIPEIRQLVMEEQEETKQAKLEEVRQKKLASDQAKLSKAKSLNVSLKPASPTGNFNSTNNANRQRNSKGPTSVRDSILSAVREVVENN